MRSVLGMKPNSEYILTLISNETGNRLNKIVELFLNNEYKGVYFVNYIDERDK